MIQSIFTAFLAICLLVSCESDRENLSPPISPKGLRVIAIGDFHGALETHDNQAQLQDGSKRLLRSGGAAYLSTVIRKLREESKTPTVVLDGGDLFQGSFISNSQEGRPVIDFYNHLKVDAAAVGNHEFDFGPSGPKSSPDSPSDDSLGALKDRIAQSSFPFLAVNIREKKTGEIPQWVKPSVLIEKGGIKIGIIGAATPATPHTTLITNIAHLDFLDNLSELIQAEAKSLRERGARYVLLTIHEGGGCASSNVDDISDVSKCDGEILPLAEALVGHVEVIVAGHTHKTMNKQFSSSDNTKHLSLMQAGAKGELVMYADLTPESKAQMHEPFGICPDGVGVRKHKDGSIEKGCSSYFLNKAIDDVEPATVREADAKVAAEVAIAQEKADSILSRPANATTLTPFHRSYSSENAMGNLLTDLLREKTGAEIALQNNGGIRGDFPVAKLTYRHIFQVQPFDDNATLVVLTGKEIRNIVEKDVKVGTDGAMSWSGLRAEVNGCEITALTWVSENGNSGPIENGKEYRIATSGYLASKMDSLTSVQRTRDMTDLGTPVRDVIFEAISGKTLRQEDYFSPSSPRVHYTGTCGPLSLPQPLSEIPKSHSHGFHCSH